MLVILPRMYSLSLLVRAYGCVATVRYLLVNAGARYAFCGHSWHCHAAVSDWSTLRVNVTALERCESRLYVRRCWRSPNTKVRICRDQARRDLQLKKSVLVWCQFGRKTPTSFCSDCVCDKMSKPARTVVSAGAWWIKKITNFLLQLTEPASSDLVPYHYHHRRSKEHQRLKDCIKFLERHGIQGLLESPVAIKNSLHLISRLLVGMKEVNNIVFDLLLFAAAWRKEAAYEIFLKSSGPWSSVHVFDWRVDAFYRPAGHHCKRTMRVPRGIRDDIFPMLLRTYHSDLNTHARGCLHVVYLLGSNEELLSLLCAGASKLAGYPGTSSTVHVPASINGDDLRVTLSGGETALDTAQRYKQQLKAQEKYELLTSFQLTLQERCLMTIRKEVGRLTTERIQALPLPLCMKKKLLFEDL